MKLRLLVDGGATFVGHGLDKDFRTLNLFVPDSQIKDTAKLFKLAGARYLSLRFLAAHQLGIAVQVRAVQYRGRYTVTEFFVCRKASTTQWKMHTLP